METDIGTRDRLLRAAAELLDDPAGRPFSTRAVCDRAGVAAPTLYHHFGNKLGLIDEVSRHLFTRYTAARPGAPETGSEVVQELRDSWDAHVRFGLEHPSFYAFVYGQVRPGRPCTISALAEEALAGTLLQAERTRLLRTDPATGAAHLLAATVGVTLQLIGQGATFPSALSDQVRDGALAAVLHLPGADDVTTLQTVADTLRGRLHETPALSDAEARLMQEWLDRIGAP